MGALGRDDNVGIQNYIWCLHIDSVYDVEYDIKYIFLVVVRVCAGTHAPVGAHVPAGLTLGRNVVVRPDAREEDYGGGVESGGGVG